MKAREGLIGSGLELGPGLGPVVIVQFQFRSWLGARRRRVRFDPIVVTPLAPVFRYSTLCRI